MLLTADMFNISSNATPADLNAFKLALSYLNGSADATAYMQQLAVRHTTINFIHGEENTESDPENNEIDWNPRMGANIYTNPSGGEALQPDSVSTGTRSAAVLLAHEAVHIVTGPMGNTTYDADYETAYEKGIIEKENIFAAQLGEASRYNHGGVRFYGDDPTEHTMVIDGSVVTTVWVTVDKDGNPVVQGYYQPGAYPDAAPVFAPSGTTVFDDSGTHPYLAETSTYDINGVLQTQLDVLDSGEQLLKYYDTHNSHPYSELDVSEDATGKPTNVAVTLDPSVVSAINAGGSIGQVFGSSIGRAIAGNNQFAQLAAGTVGGFIGQKLAAEIAKSLQTDASDFSFADAFSNFNVSITGAGAGSVASFLTAELGTALGLSGYGEHLFTSAVGGYAGSVLNQVITNSFNGVTASINWTAAFSSATSAVSGTIGTLLAQQLVHAENAAGAIGGQLAGAVGGIIGAAMIGLDVVLDVILPGIGAFLGTVLGTLVGNVIGGDHYPRSFESVTPGSSRYQSNWHDSEDGGDPNVSAAMGNASVGMINAYLSAV